MQTFLPYKSFSDSHFTLDNVRLGNQVYREGKTLLGGGWPNHPASKMWRGYEFALAEYCYKGVIEMINRVNQGTANWRQEVCTRWYNYFSKQMDELPFTGYPDWLGNEDFHRSHRSNLLRKDPIYYRRFAWDTPNDLEYVWPS